jgi:hypothetical protein
MMLATQELRRRRHKHSSQRDLSAKTIGDFLQSVEIQELVLSQRLRDLQTGKTRSEPDSAGESPLVNSGPSSVGPFLVAPQVPVPDANEEYETYGAF